MDKLKTKMEGRNLKFSIKTVSEKTGKKAMSKMQKKKRLDISLATYIQLI